MSTGGGSGGGSHSRESRCKLLSDSSGTKRVQPGMTGSGRRVLGTTGNSTNAHDRDETGISLATDQAAEEIQQQSTERLVTSVLTLSNSSETSKVPPESLTSDTSTSSGSNKKTSPPPTSQSAALSSNSLSNNSTLITKKTSTSSESATVLQHQPGATSDSGTSDSITNSVFPASSTLCVNEMMRNSTEGMASVGPAVTSADTNDSVQNRVSGSATETERLLLVRPQTVTVGRQKSEDDMEHMQEVADDLVAKLMDDEEGHEKLITSLQQTSVAEKWYYRDPQGEVQGPFLSGEMAEWFRAGYFTLNLLVKRSCDDRYSQLGDLIKIWGRIPFMPGHAVPPLKGGDSVPTSVPTTGQSTLTQAVTAPTVPTGLEQENLLMQHYHYQYLQRQFLLRQQAVTGKLSQTEHWSSLTPLEQQQLIMQQMLSQPITQQPVDPFMQQMAAHMHKAPVLHLLSQLHQPKVPTTSMPDSQHPPAQTQTPALEPLQQLIQQMGGLQQLPASTGHQSLLHSQPLSVPNTTVNKSDNESNPIQMFIRQLGTKASKPQLESVWGGNMTPGATSAAAAAAAAAAAFTTPGWLGQIPAAPPGQLPPSSMWDLHGKDVKTEQQILVEQMRAEEERRRDELRKQEETQRKTEEEEEKRKQLEEELRKKEAEKQKLEEQMQKMEEERKQEEWRRKEEERERLEEKRRLEEQLRQEEEQKHKLAEEAAERKRQQEETKRLEEEAAAHKREEAARKKEEERKRKEEEKEKKRKLEEERKREDEERRRLEEEVARKKQQQDEEERRLEQQRRQTEALRRLQEQQQRAKSAPWSQQTPGAGSSLADIQRQEKEKKERELREQQQLLLQQQQQSQLHLQSQASESSVSGNSGRSSNSLQLKWADRKPVPVNKVKSLAEIQAEEQEQLAKQQEKERAERAQQQKEIALPPSAGIWGAASQSLSWASSCPNTTTVWGSTTPATTGVVGFWDEVAPSAPKPSGKSVGGKAKVGAATSTVGNSSSGKASGSKTRSKKEEALVWKLFEQNVPRGDEFTQWCSKALSGLQSSVDIPTFVGFLRDIESPYEVKDYVRLYLGEGKEVQEFARQFLERRSKWRSAQRAVPLEDDMCVPAPAVNPLTTDFQEVKGRGKKAKKSKMFRVDNRILGFSVTAAQDRINVGDRDYGDGL
ncbi:hypothetical protein B7P43_G03863 [Cryptotermes secundus]|nr:hypothetical protein B7P43_G03863 [Cryptotermes secundus]